VRRGGWRGAVALAAALAAPACKGDKPEAAPAPAAQPAAPPPIAKDAGAPPPVVPAKPTPATRGPCTAAEIKTARAEARAMFDQKAFRASADRLEALMADCVLDDSTWNQDESAKLPNLDYYWIQSDLALALHRAGDHAGCLAITAPLTTPAPPLSIYLYDLEEEKVGKALLHNEELCRKAHEAGRSDFKAPPCPFKTDGQAAAALGEACLVLGASGDPVEFEKALDEEVGRDTSALCPTVSAFTRKGGAEPVETLLEARDGPLTDISDCCNITEIATAVRKGARMIRVRGGGRDCFGGTAETDLDALYEWKGDDTLEMVENASVASH
jgi:hypothetical protein